MVILVYAETTNRTVRHRLGMADYSYYFVLEQLLPILEKLGTVVAIEDERSPTDSDGKPVQGRDAETIVNAVSDFCGIVGESCVFLSFAPPYKTRVNVKCPVVPVFAWEFPDLPSEAWNRDPRTDWRYVLEQTPAAITHSSFSRDVVRDAMTDEFVIESVPAPVWSTWVHRSSGAATLPDLSPCEISFDCSVTDSRKLGLSLPSPHLQKTPFAARASSDFELSGEQLLIPPDPAVAVELDGVVYTSIFNPNDGRKQWRDMLRCFCLGLRDCPDATLVLKLVYVNSEAQRSRIENEMARAAPFACRVLIVDGFLDDATYESLAVRSTYAVNVSRGEGQCLPLMEYMSAGTPAVAPQHTAMRDYIRPTNSFVYATTLEPVAWPTDPRQRYRTLGNRADCVSLMAAFRESYRVAKEEPAQYRRMSEEARNDLRGFCSADVVEPRLRNVLRRAVRSTSS